MVTKKPKEKKCKVCPNRFIPSRPLQRVCSMACAIVDAQKKTKKKVAKERREGLVKLMTHNDWTQLLQAVFNKFIRTRDAGLPCISCGTTLNVRYDAGHYYPTTYSFLRFNEDNVHRQCSNNCNKHQSGNLIQYRKGLIRKIGIEKVEWLDANCHREQKLSIPEIQELIEVYKYKTKLLINGNTKSEEEESETPQGNSLQHETVDPGPGITS